MSGIMDTYRVPSITVAKDFQWRPIDKGEGLPACGIPCSGYF